VIFADTNVFYNFFFETELSPKARAIFESAFDVVTSFTVFNELVFITLRKLAERNYNVKNYFDFRRFIVQNGYEHFEDELNILFEFFEARGILILSDYQDVHEWKRVMDTYHLLPNDALIAVTCRHHGIDTIATFDDDFRRVDFLNVIP